MSQEPYYYGTTSVNTGSTDSPILTTIFGTGWQSSLEGMPNNLILRFDRDITFKIGSTSNDAVNPRNTYNKLSTFTIQDFLRWYEGFALDSSGNTTFEIYVSNASGASCNVDVFLLPNRLNVQGTKEIAFDLINGDASEATLLLILAELVTANVHLTAIQASDASIDTKLTTTNALLTTIDADTSAIAISTANIDTNTASIDTKLTTTNSLLTTIDTDTGNIATSTNNIDVSTASIDTKLTTTNNLLTTIDSDTSILSGELVTDGQATNSGVDLLTPIAGQDGTDYQAILTDTTGKIIISNEIIDPSTQNVATVQISDNTTSGNNAATTLTVPSGGARYLWWNSNSSLRYQINWSAGAQVINILAGDSQIIPCNIASTTVISLKPTSGNMVSGTDYVTIGVS